MIAWTDADGTLSRWPDPIPPTSPDPIKAQRTSGVNLPLKRKGDPLSVDEDGEGGRKNVASGLEDLTGDVDYGMEDDDWMIDDIGLLDSADREKDRVEKEFAKEMGMSLDYSLCSHNFVRLIVSVSVTKAQPAFQPGSTPMANKKRYLGIPNSHSVLYSRAF